MTKIDIKVKNIEEKVKKAFEKKNDSGSLEELKKDLAVASKKDSDKTQEARGENNCKSVKEWLNDASAAWEKALGDRGKCMCGKGHLCEEEKEWIDSKEDREKCRQDLTSKSALGPIEKPFLDRAEDRRASRQAVSQEDRNTPKEAKEARMAVNKEVSMDGHEIVPGENWEDLKEQISNSKKAAETLGIIKSKDDGVDTLKDIVEMTQKSPYSKETVTDYEYVNHPKHYNNYDIEVIDMMIKLFGAHETISFCKLNAFKYRMRAGTKPDTPAEQDIQKEQWYLRKAEELESLIF